MKSNTWSQEFSELVEAASAAFVRFWKQDLLQVGLTVLMFLALAVPLVLVMLLLWYLDYTGWRPSRGFYTIGMSPESLVWQAKLLAVGFAVVKADDASASNWPAGETDPFRGVDS